MLKRTRITLTNAESESDSGKRLLDLIFMMCHDGKLGLSEVNELHHFLIKDQSTINAIPFLRSITRQILADGVIDDAEAYNLKAACERIVPKQARGIISTHLKSIDLPNYCDDEPEPWTNDDATPRQIEYIINLGGKPRNGMSKGDASRIIAGLLERRPPTPRQVMVLRFFNRLDLQRKTKDEVSEWIDILFAEDYRNEQAWDRFKRQTNQDPFEQDPNIVPIGAYIKYL